MELVALVYLPARGVARATLDDAAEPYMDADSVESIETKSTMEYVSIWVRAFGLRFIVLRADATVVRKLCSLDFVLPCEYCESSKEFPRAFSTMRLTLDFLRGDFNSDFLGDFLGLGSVTLWTYVSPSDLSNMRLLRECIGRLGDGDFGLSASRLSVSE